MTVVVALRDEAYTRLLERSSTEPNLQLNDRHSCLSSKHCKASAFDFEIEGATLQRVRRG